MDLKIRWHCYVSYNFPPTGQQQRNNISNISNGIADSSLVKWLLSTPKRKAGGLNPYGNSDSNGFENEEEVVPLFSSQQDNNNTDITNSNIISDMSHNRGQRNGKAKRGIPPELMNVEFNPNDPQGDGGVEDSNGGLHMANGGGHHGEEQFHYNYGQPQRSFTYKDRPGSLRGDGYGGGGKARYNPVTNPATLAVQSHNYEPDESEVWRAYVAQVHFSNRGQWWTTGKKRSLKRWILTFAVGVVQAVVAAVCNFASRSMATRKFEYVYDLLNPSMEAYTEEMEAAMNDDDVVEMETFDDYTSGSSGGLMGSSTAVDSTEANLWTAFRTFVLIQVLMCAVASIFVYIGKYRMSQ